MGFRRAKTDDHRPQLNPLFLTGDTFAQIKLFFVFHRIKKI